MLCCRVVEQRPNQFHVYALERPIVEEGAVVKQLRHMLRRCRVRF